MTKQDQEINSILDFSNGENMTDEDKVKETIQILEEEGDEDITHEEAIDEIVSLMNSTANAVDVALALLMDAGSLKGERRRWELRQILLTVLSSESEDFNLLLREALIESACFAGNGAGERFSTGILSANNRRLVIFNEVHRKRIMGFLYYVDHMTDEEKDKACLRILTEDAMAYRESEIARELASRPAKIHPAREWRFSDETEKWLGRDIPEDYRELPGDAERWRARKLPEEIKQWFESRREAGRLIDPKTAAHVHCRGYIFDPYNLCYFLPMQSQACDIGKLDYFRSPGSDIWVEEGDLPHLIYLKEKVSEKVREKAGSAI